jgi:hypothetical protein
MVLRTVYASPFSNISDETISRDIKSIKKIFLAMAKV